LCDPDRYTLAEAIAAARKLSIQFPDLDLALLEVVLPKGHAMLEESRSNFRILEILAALPVRQRAMPQLLRLLRYPQVRMQSKVVLLIGRLRRMPNWIAPFCANADDRMRANAVESLWENRDSVSISLFLDALRDPHHRVAANGLVGLCLAGRPEGSAGICKMTQDGSPLRRAAAAWALGRIGEPQAIEPLRRLREDPDERVRGAALRALVRIRKNAAAENSARAPQEPGPSAPAEISASE
jgi:HEAT repeat protein